MGTFVAMKHNPVVANFLSEAEKCRCVAALANSSLAWATEHKFLGIYKLYNILHKYYKKY